MKVLFTFFFDPETKEAGFQGNVQPQVALNILQNIVIADAISRSKKEESKKEEPDEQVHSPELQ